MEKIELKILGLFKGTPKPLGEKKQVTAIVKAPVNELEISKEFIQGDQVANLKHHGGEDRVVHHYTGKQYAYLKSFFTEQANQFVPGSYGENIYTEDLTEKELCIGDIFQVGTVKLQLTEPRNPCGTIDLRYGFKGVLKEILNTRRYGWFYRVLEPGKIKMGDRFELIERPYPDLNLDKLIFEAKQNKNKDFEFIKKAATCAALSKRYRIQLEKLLK